MVQLDKLLDAWRADPRADSTIELGNMLFRANVKAKGALPRTFIVEFGDEAARAHPQHMEVLEVLSRLFAVSGEGSRAQALYARSAALFPRDPRVAALQNALRGDGLAVPPPDVAAKLAPPVPEPEAPLPPKKPEPPPKREANKEFAAPRPLQTSLADFMPPVGAKPFPVEASSPFAIDMEPSTSTGIHTDPTRDLPPHVPEVPTSELSTAGIDAALGEDASIPRRVRAPTHAGLGPLAAAQAAASVTARTAAPHRGAAAAQAILPAPGRSQEALGTRVRPQTSTQGSGLPPSVAMGPQTAVAPTQRGPSRRSNTLIAEHGVAPPALAPPARVNALPALDPAPVRMFTPVRAFTPPPGNLAWGEIEPPPEPPEETRGEETTQGGHATTSLITANTRAAAGMMIDSPTTTQDTLTRPLSPRVPVPTLRGAPSLADAPPTQTRLVPQEDQLRAAAASIISRPAGASAEQTSSRPAARRAAGPTRERIRFDSDEDDPPTSVTSTATDVQVAPRAVPEIPNLGIDMAELDAGQATARRDTSELLAAALLHRSPSGAPALGAPSAAPPPAQAASPPVPSPHPAMVARPPAGPPPPAVPVLGPAPALPPPSTLTPGPRPGPPPIGLPPASPAGPTAKPTLLSRTPGQTPPVKPTLMSPGARSPARPHAAPPGPQAPPSSAAVAPGAPESSTDTADETSTKVRPLAPSAPPPMKVGPPMVGPPMTSLAPPVAALPPSPGAHAPGAHAPPDSTTMSRAITDLWEPPEKRPSSATFDPRREPDEDGPATNVFSPPAQVHQIARAAAAQGAHPSPMALAGIPLGAIPIVDDSSFAEEISTDSIETIDAVPESSVDTSDQPTGRVEVRGKPRSTQKIAGTVAPAVVWSPSAATPDDAEQGVRTRVLTAEQSAAAGRVDPLPSSPSGGNEWVITPPPPVAPRFGPPPASVRQPSSIPNQLPPPISVPPSSFAQPRAMPSARPPPPFESGASRPPPQNGSVAAVRGRASPSPILVGSVIGVALSVLVAGGVWLYGLASESKAPSVTTTAAGPDVESMVLGGRKEELDRADAILSGTVPKGKEKTFALARAHERALRALELGVTDRIADAMSKAKQSGATDEELAFLELARAVADRNGEAERALLAKWTDLRKSDAYFLLAAGVSLEQRGDRLAIEKYGAALGAEPRLRPAALRLARAELLDGDTTRGVARVEGLAAQGAQAPEVLALRGLVWLRSRNEQPGKGVPAPAVPAPDVLPIELRFVPAAVAIISSVPPSKRGSALEDAAKQADTPSVEVLFGTIAFDLHAEASALEISRAALGRAPDYPPTLLLFAKSGLALAKLDAIDEVAKSLPTAQQKLLGAITAYERGDVTTVVEVRSWLGQRDEPGREGIVARAERLVGSQPMPPARIKALQRPDVAGGDLVAVDALLDSGDLKGARSIVDQWSDPSSHPLRALRAARLLRYEGKLGEAESALDVAAPTQPALVERVLIEADKADERAHARSMLDARFGEDRFYYEAYLLALDDRMPAARKLLDTLPVPGDDAPLARRVAAALAFGAADDKDRARELVRRLSAVWPRNPDVERARRALDSRPR